MVFNRWSDEMDSPNNEPVYIGYAGNPSEEIWTMKDGTKIRVGDMTDTHLRNCYGMVEDKNLFWSQVFKAETEKRVDKAIENTPAFEKIDFEDIPNEMTNIVDEMQKALSDAYTDRLRADELKLEEVLRKNGWCRAVDLIDEIELATRQLKMPTLARWNLEDLFMELREKYSGGKK